ncbi:unnamed protein product [Medioppia subpectinata]|uniref:RING-type domain-containing protein n=1 Tax=Medioppia subpectinata TaxID=1979941 RepID=A0A7R9KZT0_9ACAR|nr:unnamed protein product [Medioppia subpectinata]CAG2112960.1 unnamed protein product [Medioppia subpectinata]
MSGNYADYPQEVKAMPGYDSDRFVGLDEPYRQELLCGICAGILQEPLFTQCCLQTFCKECIDAWLKTSHTCPLDRKPLTIAGLAQPPRLLLNVLSKLEISCDFKDKGCPEVVTLEQLPKHVSQCLYNIIKCYKCFCDYHSNGGHECVQSLLQLNKTANKVVEDLKTERDQLLEQIKQMSANQSIPIIQNSRRLPQFPSLPTTSNPMANVISEYEAIVSSRSQSSLIQIVENNLTEEMSGVVMSITSEQIHENTSLSIICENIVHKLNDTFGREWQCSAGFRTGHHSYRDFKPQFHLRIHFGLEITEEEAIICARIVSLEPKIIQNHLNRKQTQKLLSIVRTQLMQNNTISLICKNICHELNNDLGLNWHSYARYGQPFHSSFTYEKEFLIELQFNSLYFQIYKTEI